MKELAKGDANGSAEMFVLEEFLPHRLSVASDGVCRLVTRHYLEQVGLAIPEWRLLAAVGRYGVLSPTAAGERTSMDKVKISRAAAGLVDRGLLKQSQDPDDGRGRLLRLTRKGAAIYNGIPAMAQRIEKMIATGLTAAEWGALNKTLKKLIDHTRTVLNGEARGRR